MDPRLYRLLFATMALALFYRGLFCARPALQSNVPQGQMAPEQARALLARSAELMRRERYQDALEPALDLHRAFPGNHVYLERMAVIYDHLGRYAEESAMWEQFLLHAPTPVEACPRIGDAYRKQGLLDQWVDACQRCWVLDPENPDMTFYLAYACERTGQIERAKELYTEGLRQAPGYDDIKLGLARIALRDGDSEQALALAEQVLAKLPDYVDALLVKGIVRFRQGDSAAARELLERGVRASPDYADFHVMLGMLAESEGRHAEALDHYERVIEIDPKNEDAKRRHAQLLAERK